MAKSTISIGFKIEEGKDGLKQLALDANDLKKVMQANVGEVKSLKKSMISLGAVSFGLDAMTSALGSLQSAMGGLIKSYDVQMEAETKLQTVMRQRLGATDAEIQSIKDLCAVQQQLGVIGDEVQLAGAQQLTTFLNTREALATLIPAMNNLIAQKSGYNATTSDAVNIGNLFGKVMQGQVNALKKVGITFSEAEKKAILLGTEEERAAILAKIITNNVGEMNAALAATPTGKMKQMENTIGDLQEKIGGVLKDLNGFIAPINQIFLMGANMTKLISSFNALKTSAELGFSKILQGAQKGIKAITGMTVAANSLKIALGGIITVAAVAAVMALHKGLQQLAGQTQETEERLRMLSDIHSEASKNAEEQRVKIDLLVKAANNEKLSLEERQSAIHQLNSIIPDYNAYLDETTGKYKDNKTALDNYLKSLVKKYEIEGAQEKLKEIGRRKAEARLKRSEAIKEHESIKEKTSKRELSTATASPAVRAIVSSSNSEVGKATTDASRVNSSYKKIVDATKEYNSAVAEEAGVLAEFGLDMQKEAVSVKGIAEDSKKNKKNGGGSNHTEEILPEGSIADYQKQISELNKQISLSIDPVSIAEMTRQIKDLEMNIWDLKVRARIEGDRSGFDKMVQDIEAMPITVDVTVKPDIKGIKNLDLGTSKWYQDFIDSQEAAKNLQENISGIAEVARAAGSAFTSMGDAMENPALNVAGIIAGAIANVMAGYAAATAKETTTPWEWIAFSVSGLATALAAVSQIKQATAFANGGIVSGPTMALVGEYAGARNNPEVIAPLNKLRELLPENGGGVQHVVVSGRLKGSDIVLASSNYTNIRNKSRR